MVTEQIAEEQVKRFTHYPGFPKDEERAADLDELIFAFQEAAQDMQHARDIGDYLIRRRSPPDCRFCPMPGEVFAAAAAIRPDETVRPVAASDFAPKAGDEPFGGIPDLIDERILSILRRKAETGRTSAERKSAKEFIQRWAKQQQETEAQL